MTLNQTSWMFDMLLGENLQARKEFISNNGVDYLVRQEYIHDTSGEIFDDADGTTVGLVGSRQF